MTSTSLPPLRVLVLAGSSRQGSYNQALAQAALQALRAAGATATLGDLRALALPIYDGDLESAQGVPEGARTLREWVGTHDALVVVSPEYNALPTPLLINSFDWLSRLGAEAPWPAGAELTAGKVVGLLAASPGALGGLRALPIVRQFLSTNFGMLVVPEHFGLSRAHEALNVDGTFKEVSHQRSLDRVVQGVLRVAGALKKQ